VVIDQINIIGIAFGPAETYAPLVVHANAVLSLAISQKLLKTIPRGNPQIIDSFSGIQQEHLSQGDSLYVGWILSISPL
jgi:hypothetical protein